MQIRLTKAYGAHKVGETIEVSHQEAITLLRERRAIPAADRPAPYSLRVETR